jgi:hypothetical protein
MMMTYADVKVYRQFWANGAEWIKFPQYAVARTDGTVKTFPDNQPIEMTVSQLQRGDYFYTLPELDGPFSITRGKDGRLCARRLDGTIVYPDPEATIMLESVVRKYIWTMVCEKSKKSQNGT